MEQDTHTKETFFSDVIKRFKDDGICIFEGNAFTPEQLNYFTSAIDVKSNESSDYKFGKSYNTGDVHNWIGTPIWEFATSNFMTGFVHHYFNRPVITDVFLTHEYKNNEGLDRNGFLHFDRLRCVKFFIYLTDCDEESGAFHFVPNSHKHGKQLREQGSLSYEEDFDENRQAYETKKNRLVEDFPELGYKNSDAIPIIGKAGTMFVFDTDLFHFGGKIQEGKERKVMRIHLK
mgnify:CR=1 FL=1|tara:strand:- start:3163 stop:3858 length:696 start_codon:yes stop_codon:yes gene_type:complete